MKRWLILILLCLLPVAGWAEVPVPTLQARVTDLTNTLTEAQRSSLEARLAAFEAEKGSQIAVLLVPTTQPETIEQYSIRVAEQWKLGRKGVDDGVLVLLARNDRAARIEVGYGLEGAIPDAIAKRVVEDYMIPKFREGDYFGGITAGLDALIAAIHQEPLPEPKRASKTGHIPDNLFMLFFAALVLGGILRMLLGAFMGGLVNGGVIGLAVWLMGAPLAFALFFAFMAFMMAIGGGRGHGGRV